MSRPDRPDLQPFVETSVPDNRVGGPGTEETARVLPFPRTRTGPGPSPVPCSETRRCPESVHVTVPASTSHTNVVRRSLPYHLTQNGPGPASSPGSSLTLKIRLFGPVLGRCPSSSPLPTPRGRSEGRGPRPGIGLQWWRRKDQFRRPELSEGGPSEGTGREST